jgi:hypothetical protein
MIDVISGLGMEIYLYFLNGNGFVTILLICLVKWYHHGESNPDYIRERDMS